MLKSDTCKLAVFALAFSLAGCGTNPVTHKRELQLVSESQEISIGQENYAPARQQQGGDYIVDPELTAYVQSVGNKLAAVSDRQLPYEFVVLNDSVPNAWALPGGKIAFNRGLLYELDSEAELAAVLGHEIVHAAARHGAQKMETGMLLQGAVIAAGVAARDKSYANLVVGGAQLSSQLIATKFSRDEESEADLYGMHYMKKAGYDPTAAVTLQETFVRLSKDRRSGFIDGLFASHPPSDARVAANKATLAELGAGGEWGREIYAQKVGKLKATQAAYKAYDDGVQALAKGEVKQADALARQAVAAEPREARFHELQGDIAMKQKHGEEALGYYQRAIDLQPDYFRPYVQKGAALASLGRKAEAEPYLKRSNELLPTATGFYLLGQLAEDRGDVDSALAHYQTAADSDSEVGRSSIARYVRLDLPRNPAKYLEAAAQADNAGNVFAVVSNPTGTAVANVYVRVLRVDAATGRVVAQSDPLLVAAHIDPQQRGQLQLKGVRVSTAADLKLYRVVVEGAEVTK
ncbi:MAG TPA: M48 family metalloprotease [Gallionella sp.]|nr:M48 family metalloprotease [Gallionella sp.]